MAGTDSTDVSGGAIAPPDPWDPLIRLSHWAIACAVIVNGLISKPGGTIHVWIGWAALGILCVRLIWGVIGSSEARFSAFPPDPRAAISHLFGVFRREPPPNYPSHNPAGAMMAYALWACLAIVTATGLLMTDAKSPIRIAQEKAAVAAGDWSVLVNESDDEEGGQETGVKDLAEEAHEVAANLMLILALIHVAGVVAESRAMKRNLVHPMLLGSGKDR